MDCSLELDPTNVCRICLEPQENPLSIFTKHIVEGNIKTLPEIILSCFAVDVIANPVLPKNICESCKASVIQFFKFKENVIRTEKLLSEIFKEVTFKEEDEEIDELGEIAPLVETYVEYEDQYEEEVQLDVCEDESSKTAFEEEFPQTEVEVYIAEKVEPYEDEEHTNMEIIDETTTPYGEFDEEAYIDDIPRSDEEHEVILEQPDECEDYEVESAPKRRRCKRSTKDGDAKGTLTLMCKICNKRIKIDDENHDKLHDYYALIVATENFLQCQHCDQVFICEDELQVHLQLTHYVNKVEDEEDILSDIQRLDEAAIRKFWVCGNCSTDFANLSDLKMHMVTHMAKIGCPVDDCGFTYANFHYFYQHIKRNHLTTELLNCKYCGKPDIADFRALQNHYRSECKAKKFKCEYCNRTFFTDKSWKTHVEIRHIAKKFICELCGKSFAQITELRIHTRMHTGERPFECTICKKAYKTASGRASHMDAHSNKAFPCDICGKQMNSRRNLVTHVRRHTEEKRLKCEVCGKKFFTKWHLNLHASKMHNNIK